MLKKLYGVLHPLFAKILGDLSYKEFFALLSPREHSPLVQRRRATLIISRARMVATIFGVLTPLWVVVDLIVFDWPLWGILGAGRLLASLAFIMLALSFRNSEQIHEAYQALGILLVIPTAFYLFSHPILNLFEVDGVAAVLASGYAFLPFVMVAGLAVFPVTVFEGILFGSPMVISVIFSTVLQMEGQEWAEYIGAIWLLSLIGVVAILAGMSQLHFMMALVRQASHDGLTKAFTRRCGEELIDVQYQFAKRQNVPLAIGFIDLDHFKQVNDTFGHEEGDRVLSNAADAMRHVLRRGDLLIRWGGEEFVIVLTGTDQEGAVRAIERLRENGLGRRPDGTAQTASIGLAERATDETHDWIELIELADKRMYIAKQTGRDRFVHWDNPKTDDFTTYDNVVHLK